MSHSPVNKMKIKADKWGNPILNQFSQDSFVDCVLKINKLKVTPKFYEFHLSASSDNEILGMDVKVMKEIQGAFDQNMNLIKNHVYQKGVVFNRSGVESDRLIKALQKLYGLKGNVKKMVSE